MKRSFLDCRLVHKDYDKNLEGTEKRNMQTNCKNELLANFIKSFNLTNAIIKDYDIISDKDTWHFSVTHARGTTMIFIAKWFVGLDCQANVDVPNNYKELAQSHFSETEKQWFNGHSDPLQFLWLWVSKESFYKCYFNEFKKAPDFGEWKLIEYRNNLAYTNGKDTYECQKGIGGNTYTFTVCAKVI